MTMHNFQTDFTASVSCSLLPIWNTLYSETFPNMVSSSINYDVQTQRLGIDRYILLTTGTILTIEEKVRYKHYGDIAIEEWSNYENRIKGWTEKPLVCDYVIYAILPPTGSNTFYILPFQKLQKAWFAHKKEWKGHLNWRIATTNMNYTTIGWGIPAHILQLAMLDENYSMIC